MRPALLLGALVLALTSAAGCSKLTGMSAKSDFINQAGKFAYEVARQKPSDRRASVDELEAIFQSFIDANPDISLVGELEVKVVPFANGGNDEPAELEQLKTLYKGNARNLAIRDRNVELVGIVANLKAGGETFTVEEWAYVADP